MTDELNQRLQWTPITTLIELTHSHIISIHRSDSGGHDVQHVLRVVRTACEIADDSGADRSIVELAALLHDAKDYKTSGSFETAADYANEWLLSQGADPALAADVAAIVGGVSFRGASVEDTELSAEGQCVRDADRLDAMGAVGIARVFAYGGKIGRPIYDPEVPLLLAASQQEYRDWLGTSIGHFFEKLLLLSERMTTVGGRRRARQRHAILAAFVVEFFDECGSPLPIEIPECPWETAEGVSR